MMLSPEFREVVLSFLDHEISIYDLEEWMTVRMVSLMADPDSDDADMVATIELGLAEMSDGVRTVAQFEDLVRAALPEHRVIFGMARVNPATTSAASAEVIRRAMSTVRSAL